MKTLLLHSKKTLLTVICLLTLCSGTNLLAQETQTEDDRIVLPDLQTAVDGTTVNVVEQALPDFSEVLPPNAPSLFDTPPLSVPTNEEEPVIEYVPQDKEIFSTMLVGAGYKNYFIGDLQIQGVETENPFTLAFFHETINGYGRHSAADGFFNTETEISGFIGTDTYDISDSANFAASGLFSTTTVGMQNQSDFFYSSTVQDANISADYVRTFGSKHIKAGFDASYTNRFLGTVNSAISAVGSDFDSVNTVISPYFEFGFFSITPLVTAEYTAFWLDTQQIDLYHRGELTLGSMETFNLLNSYLDKRQSPRAPAFSDSPVNHVLRNTTMPGTIFDTLPFTFGASVSAVISSTDSIIVPFSLGVALYGDGGDGLVKIEGGLKSHYTDSSELYHNHLYTTFMQEPNEQSDWYASLLLTVSNDVLDDSELHYGTELDFSKTAFGNGTLFPDYESYNANSGFYALTVQDRTLFNTDIFAGLQMEHFSVILGFESQWIDKDATIAEHAIASDLSFYTANQDYRVAFDTAFDITGDTTPNIGVAGFAQVSDSVLLSLEFFDVIKLFSAKDRVLVGPYIERSGGVDFKVTMNF